MLELNDWVEELKNSDKIILVEGKNDVLALKQLGINNDIVFLNKPLFEVVEDIVNNKNNKKITNKKNNKEVIILTDLDKKGKQRYGKLKKDLCRNGCKIDFYFREFLQRKTKIRQIEGLPRYLERLK